MPGACAQPATPPQCPMCLDTAAAGGAAAPLPPRRTSLTTASLALPVVRPPTRLTTMAASSSSRHFPLSELPPLPPAADSSSYPATSSSSAQQLQDALAFCRQHGAHTSPAAFTGAAGLAFAMWRAGQLTGGQQALLDEAQQLARIALAQVQARPGYYVQESLLDGEAGVVLINALMEMASSAPDARQRQQALLACYADICRAAAQPESGASDEVLYGRAGTLFGALLLRHQQQGDGDASLAPAVSDTVVRGLAQAILASGRSLARAPAFAATGPLAYVWPAGRSAQLYLGAAHGLSGILYVLLLVLQHAPSCLDSASDAADIRAALSYVLTCERDAPGAAAGSGGHYPALIQGLQGYDGHEGGAALVHWCHGAPGAVFLLATAHEVLGADASDNGRYLAAALRAGEVVWQRGLLKKGPGLCHGVSGNALALLRLHKATGDSVWLQRAQRYAAFLTSDAGRAGWAAPDHPASLFEGLGGAVCLLAELSASCRTSGGGAHQLPAFPLFELARYV